MAITTNVGEYKMSNLESAKMALKSRGNSRYEPVKRVKPVIAKIQQVLAAREYREKTLPKDGFSGKVFNPYDVYYNEQQNGIAPTNAGLTLSEMEHRRQMIMQQAQQSSSINMPLYNPYDNSRKYDKYGKYEAKPNLILESPESHVDRLSKIMGDEKSWIERKKNAYLDWRKEQGWDI